MNIRISTQDPPPLEFTHDSVAAEVMQNLYLIVTTPFCTVPGYRSFGLDMAFMHAPDQIARSRLLVALNEALSAFEPRATLQSADFKVDIDGKLALNLEVTIRG